MRANCKHVFFFGAAALVALLAAPWTSAATGQDPAHPWSELQADAQYVGAAKCKSCHNVAARGAIYSKWQETLHAKAVGTLSGDLAKEAGAGRGVADPAKAPECLKCHTTAFGVEPKRVNKRFKAELGVQCESCHGPGGNHMKARLRAAAKGFGKGEAGPLEIPAGEMTLPTEAVCRGCHNPESPQYKEFKFEEFLPKIRHMHPNRKEPRVKAPKEKEMPASPPAG